MDTTVRLNELSEGWSDEWSKEANISGGIQARSGGRVWWGGLSAGKVAAELGLHETVLRRWIRHSGVTPAAASLHRSTAQMMTG